jgi:hypothetical protein
MKILLRRSSIGEPLQWVRDIGGMAYVKILDKLGEKMGAVYHI